jgi:subtilisin family serine protease
MKIKYRLSLTLIVTLVTACQSMAAGVIVQVSDLNKISTLINDYPAILAVQHAGNSPFFRFEVSDDLVDGFANVLELDSRVVWAEDEGVAGPGRSHSSHGSTVAAIFDRKLTYEFNSGLLQQINLTPSSVSNSPVKVGIVDTGVSPNQFSIVNHVIAKESFVESSLSSNDLPEGLDTNLNGIFDECAGHGTMVAGIILQMSPNTPLIIAKSADSDGIATSWSVLQGIVFCVENGAKVINLSLGSQDRLVGFENFLDWVDESGSVIVSPIGNNASNLALFPSAYSKVICVTGLLPDNTKAPFSNWSNLATVAAPATGISSTWFDGSDATWSGTSLSAPIVSGALAAALTISPNKSPREIRWAVKMSGRDIDYLNPLYSGQLGRLLDFSNLLRKLRN